VGWGFVIVIRAVEINQENLVTKVEVVSVWIRNAPSAWSVVVKGVLTRYEWRRGRIVARGSHFYEIIRSERLFDDANTDNCGVSLVS
jgi:hypothetical protein